MGGHHDMRTAVLALAITLAPIPPAATSVEEEGGETSAREFERELRRLACEFHVDCLGLKPMDNDVWPGKDFLQVTTDTII